MRQSHDQADVLAAVIAHKLAHDGNSPTIRELQAALGLHTTSVVVYHLTRLHQAGLIRYARGAARAIEVVGGKWLPPQETPP